MAKPDQERTNQNARIYLKTTDLKTQTKMRFLASVKHYIINLEFWNSPFCWNKFPTRARTNRNSLYLTFVYVTAILNFVSAIRSGTYQLLPHFLTRKIYAITGCVIVEIGIEKHSNCTKNNLVHNLPCGGNFFVGVYFLWEWTFSGFHVQYLKVTKMDSIWSFSLHCLQAISLKFSNVKKNPAGIFVGGSLFSRDLIIADQWNTFEVRDN